MYLKSGEDYTKNHYTEYYTRDQGVSPKEWCVNCNKHGTMDGMHACAEGDTIQIWAEKPKFVSFCGHCDNFAWAPRMGGQPDNPSLLKMLLLRMNNFSYER